MDPGESIPATHDKNELSEVMPLCQSVPEPLPLQSPPTPPPTKNWDAALCPIISPNKCPHEV